MRSGRLARRSALALALLAAVFVVAYIAVVFASRSEAVRRKLESQLSQLTGSQLRLGTMSLAADLTFHFSAVSIAAGEHAPYLEAAAIEARIAPLDWGALDVTIESPHLYLARIPSASPTSGDGTSPLRHVAIRNGVLHLPAGEDDLAVGPLTGGVDVRLRKLTLDLGEMKAKLGDLTGQVGGGHLTADLVPNGEIALAVGPLSVADSNQERAIEKLSLQATGKLDSLTPLTFAIEVQSQAGEILWHRFYADLANWAPSLTAAVQRVESGWQGDRVRLQLRRLGSFEGTARLRPGGDLSAVGKVRVPELAPLFQVAVREPLQESYPLLAQTEVAGEMSIDGEYRWRSSGVSARAAVTIHDGAVSGPTSSLQGVEINLPLALGVSPRGDAKGELRFAGMRLGAIELGATTLALRGLRDGFSLTRPVVVPLLGGTLTVNDLNVAEIASSQRQVSFSLAARDVDLGEMSRALQWPELVGRLSGDLPRLTLSAAEVRSEGEMRAAVFGGSVAIRNLHFERLLSPLASFGADLSFDDISLRKLTKTLAVGRISGTARGAISELEIAAGQPVRFDAWFETVGDGREKQTISVRAIRQISILGGAGGDPLSSRVMSLFDEYRYAQMGFRCRLENDRFTLHGIRQVEGKEYLVVGSLLPPRVNVISHTEVIAFSDMIERLRRVIDERAAEPSQEGSRE